MIQYNNNLVGKKVKIKSSIENETYNDYRDKVLIITQATKGSEYHDDCINEWLCDFKLEDGTYFPFALYEYEFVLMVQ